MLRSEYSFLFADSLEGYLYPDTYRFDLDAGLLPALRRMLDRFDEKIVAPSALEPKMLYDTLRLASIVEREERTTMNKPIVAGILAKRLDEGMALGADATVCYAYRLTHDACTPRFIAEHITIASEYNTRNKLGLPPTPISNVTDETFFATFRPKASAYYYYLHDDAGIIRYARTLSEHNENKRLYLGR
ncbi:MAG TPA: endolytic transglycosylase MltG [bacterium]|nr:endolytic transglycosylase MltG [bacterium]